MKKYKLIIFILLFLIGLYPLSQLNFVISICKVGSGNCIENLSMNIYMTLYRVMVIFFAAALLGTVNGWVIYRYRKVIYRSLNPLIDFLRSIPAVVLLSILIIMGFHHNSPYILWILAINFAIWPVVLAVYNSLINLPDETVNSIKQLDLKSKSFKLFYIWIPLIWNKSRESGYKLSISNSLMATVTVEYILSEGGCNLCIERINFCAPGIGGIFAALQNGQSIFENIFGYTVIFVIVGITGVIVNIYLVKAIDSLFDVLLKNIFRKMEKKWVF